MSDACTHKASSSHPCRIICRQVGKAAIELGIVLELDEYIESFSPELMGVVSAWAEGARFVDVLKLSEVFEVH